MEDHRHVLLGGEILAAVHKTSSVSFRDRPGDQSDRLFRQLIDVLCAHDLVARDILACEIQISEVAFLPLGALDDPRTSFHKFVPQIPVHLIFRVIGQVLVQDASDMITGRNRPALAKSGRKGRVHFEEEFHADQHALPHEPVDEGNHASHFIAQRGKERSHLTSELFCRISRIGPACLISARQDLFVEPFIPLLKDRDVRRTRRVRLQKGLFLRNQEKPLRSLFEIGDEGRLHYIFAGYTAQALHGQFVSEIDHSTVTFQN